MQVASPISDGSAAAALRTSTPFDQADLEEVARRVRGTLLEISHRGRAPHIASALSTVDIMVAAYWGVLRVDPLRPDWPDRDRFVFSKGHAATALFSTLAHRGLLPWSTIARFNEAGGVLQEHPGPGCAPGVELATGSLGHGLPVALGMAEGIRLRGSDARVFVLMGDGECNEGSVWEAAMLAPARRLGHLCAIVDFNKWQATDRSCEVMAIEPLAEKWRSFGWHTVEVDGHDVDAVVAELRTVPNTDQPTAIVAHTVKGAGISFMEDDNNWHYRLCDAESLERAFVELGLR